jgi:hypothetical protein
VRHLPFAHDGTERRIVRPQDPAEQTVVYLLAADNCSTPKTRYNASVSRSCEGALPGLHINFPTSLQLWASCGYASCCTTSGPAKASCHLSHRPNPCPLSASANAPASPPPSRVSPNVLTVRRVQALPPIPRRCRRDDLPPCLPPTDAPVSSTPLCISALMKAVSTEAGGDLVTL